MVELPLIGLRISAEEIELLVDSVNAEINLEILIFELIKG